MNHEGGRCIGQPLAFVSVRKRLFRAGALRVALDASTCEPGNPQYVLAPVRGLRDAQGRSRLGFSRKAKNLSSRKVTGTPTMAATT